MRSPVRVGVAVLCGAIALVFGATRGEAHKPITSPYTYNDDVFPLLRDRCGRCHVSGGVAPMSLMTHAETVPWGESIKTELLAGQMPPGNVDASPARFRNVEGLTAREMNVLLTWVTGGTPIGAADKDPKPIALDTSWRLGEPDLTLQLPSATALNADTRETTAESVVPVNNAERRFVRAVDLRPGTPAIVRAATVSVKSAAAGDSERVLALWLPGDTPVALEQGLVYELPAGAELVVRVLYRKTWENERKEMADRSAIGLYFAREPGTIVRALTASSIEQDVRALAIYPNFGVRNRSVRVVARKPDGSHVDLIAFHPRPDWVRRYWFAEPISLPRGTRIEVTSKVDDEIPLLALTPANSRREDPSSLAMILDVVPGR